MDKSQIPSVDRRCLDVNDLQVRSLNSESHCFDPFGTFRVMRSRSVSQRRLVAGHDHFHPLTLPHVNGAFRVDGNWPSPITLSRGWGRATARPWNNEAPDAFVRLLRGRAEFLESVTERVAAISGSGVFSPPMFAGSMRVWKRAGYREARRLLVMERPLGVEVQNPHMDIEEVVEPPWQRVLEIDRFAFDGFWRMSLDGLREALTSTSPAAVLTASIDREVVGYAIVGAQWGTAYLQRVAVETGSAGQGIGTDLVRAAVRWARRTSAASMVLNVRSENARAVSVYERCGFSITSRTLRILRYGETSLLESK